MRRWATDLALVLALVVLLFAGPRGPLSIALAAGIPAVIGWGIVTLHFPWRVEMDGEGIAFFAYGRAHRFAWQTVERVRVRRFVVRDRVLVRISPAPPFRGRYWLVDSLEGYDAVVSALEQRQCTAGAAGDACRPAETGEYPKSSAE